LDAKPIALSSSQDLNSLWLSTDDAAIWKLNLGDGSAEKAFDLAQNATILVEEDGKYLWASDGMSMLVAIYLETNQESDLLASGLNTTVPASMAYDGVNLWLGFNFPARLATARYDGQTLRQNTIGIEGLSSLNQLASDGSFVFVNEGGFLSAYDIASEALVFQLGLAFDVSNLVVGNEAVWTYAQNTGFIFKHPLR
jgi:hypothetical protein